MGRRGGLIGGLLGMAANAVDAAVENAVKSARAKAEHDYRVKNAITRIKVGAATDEDYEIVYQEAEKALDEAHSKFDKCTQRIGQLYSEREEAKSMVDDFKTFCQTIDKCKEKLKSDASSNELLIYDNDDDDDDEFALRLAKIRCNGAEIIKAYTYDGDEFNFAEKYNELTQHLSSVTSELDREYEEQKRLLEAIEELSTFLYGN